MDPKQKYWYIAYAQLAQSGVERLGFTQKQRRVSAGQINDWWAGGREKRTKTAVGKRADPSFFRNVLGMWADRMIAVGASALCVGLTGGNLLGSLMCLWPARGRRESPRHLAITGSENLGVAGSMRKACPVFQSPDLIPRSTEWHGSLPSSRPVTRVARHAAITLHTATSFTLDRSA